MATIADAGWKRRALESGTYDVPDLAALLKCSDKHIRRKAEAGLSPA